MVAEEGLAGLAVAAFESRRSKEMGRLLEAHGAQPLLAPSMREVPLTDSAEAPALVERLRRGEIDIVVLLTGVGTRSLVEACADRYSPEQVAKALDRATLVARGPKPVGALRELGLEPDLVVPEPNTWRDILDVAEASLDLEGREVAVQEYGVSNPDLLDGLRRLGAEVVPVRVYRWALPHDTGPLEEAIRALADGSVDVVLFTSATQVDHLVQVSEADGLTDAVREGLDRAAVGSVGPICSEGLRQHGVEPDLEPPRPKMGHLVAHVATHARDVLEARQDRRAA